MMSRVLPALAGALCIGLAQAALAAVIVPGSTYSLTGTNFPGGSGTVVVTEGTSTNVLGLTVTDTIVADGPNADWFQLNFVNPTGGPLAANINANWQIALNGVQLTAPALFDNIFF